MNTTEFVYVTYINTTIGVITDRDTGGCCCGIVALADIALRGKTGETAEVVKEVSEPTAAASAAG